MTDPEHQSGTDRVAEAARGREASMVVNVQGDEPEIDPAAIELLIDVHRRAGRSGMPPFASTLVCPFPDDHDPEDPNSVKAVLRQPDTHGVRRALLFSRSRLPYPRSAQVAGAAPLLHLGLYAFTPDALQRFPTMARTPLEQTESLEQLRILEHGEEIAVGEVTQASPGIDTRADYDAFIARHRGR